MNYYQLIWAAIILYCIVMYVVLDGFTLGTGMLTTLLSESENDIAMSVILPTWDGNQTWLVLGFACLYGAFPLAFSILMPALYLPLLIMGTALLLRGVAFEFRLKSKEHRKRWSIVFALAALIVTFIQGMILGKFVQGFSLDTVHNIIVNQHLLTPFSFFTGTALVIGYMLLGSTRLILKTEGELRTKMYKVAGILATALSACIFVVSVWTPFVHPDIAKIWLNLSLWPYLVTMPATTGAAFLLLAFGIFKKIDRIPYWSAVVMFLCPYVGFCVSAFPYIIPYKLAYWQAAAPDNALKFTLVGACIMLPVLTAYTFYSYHVFRGKVNEVLGY